MDNPKSCPGCDAELSPKPVHFTLRANTELASFYIGMLHHGAAYCKFKSVGDLFYFEGDSCAVTSNDQSIELKIRARGTAIINNQVVSYMPRSFWGFETELINGNRMYIGLSEYDPYVEFPDGSIWRTGLEYTSQWQTFVQTFCSNQDNEPGDCVKSHQSVCSLLMTARSIGMLRMVSDPTGWWKNRDTAKLADLCSSLKSA